MHQQRDSAQVLAADLEPVAAASPLGLEDCWRSLSFNNLSCLPTPAARNGKPYVSNNQETRYVDEFVDVDSGLVEKPATKLSIASLEAGAGPLLIAVFFL